VPTYNKQILEVEANRFGFMRDTFEKVVRLKEILEYRIKEHPMALWKCR